MKRQVPEAVAQPLIVNFTPGGRLTTSVARLLAATSDMGVLNWLP
jgi:hypothetical protein